MYCPNCGKQSFNNNFCPFCGANLQKYNQVQSVQATPQYQQPVATPMYQQPAVPVANANSKIHKTFVIVDHIPLVTVLLLIAAIIFGMILYMAGTI